MYRMSIGGITTGGWTLGVIGRRGVMPFSSIM
jgi:hypothetical protein